MRTWSRKTSAKVQIGSARLPIGERGLDAEAWREAGRVAVECGQLALAARVLRAGLAQFPHDVGLWMDHAWIETRVAAHEDAARIHLAAARATREPRAMLEAGLALWRCGRRGRASRFLFRALAREPALASAVFEAGIVPDEVASSGLRRLLDEAVG